MTTEDYVSFELAQLLKIKGFNEDCRDSYDWGGNFHLNASSNNGSIKKIAAPTLQMAMKWLREEKNFHIVSGISYDTSVDADGNEVDRRTFWFFEILSSCSGNLIYTEEINEYDSYEEAAEAAIKYCLENLI